MYTPLYHQRRKRMIYMNPVMKGRNTSIMANFATFKQAAEDRFEGDVQKFIRIPLAQYELVLNRVADQI
jgi:hypothetical protein